MFGQRLGLAKLWSWNALAMQVTLFWERVFWFLPSTICSAPLGTMPSAFGTPFDIKAVTMPALRE